MHSCRSRIEVKVILTVMKQLNIINTLSHSLHLTGIMNSLLAFSQQGFIAQLVEHNAPVVMGLNPIEALECFLGFLCNCFS